ncbi:MAG: alpha/beta fold hydrolase [Pseudomonadota bacterium]
MGAEQAFLTEIGSAYLARAQAPHPRDLLRFKPSGLAWPFLRDMQGLVAGLQKRTVEVDGQQMTWLEGGTPGATPVVLLHGFAASKENWLPLLPFLGGHRLLIPDLPGWGESEFRYDKPYGIDHQVERLAHWLEQAAPAGAHLVGSSMGGAIAGFLAARHPQLAQSLTLMNAAGVRGSEASEFERRLMEGENLLVTHSMADVFRLFTLVTERNRHMLAATLTPVMGGQMLARRHVNAHLFHQLIEHAPREDRPGIATVVAPTLVLWGDQDRVLHVSCAETFRSLIPHAQVTRLRGIGHLPMLEVPAVTARCLQRFWRAPVAAVA